MKRAIAIVLLAAAIVAADLRSPFNFPAAKDFGSDDCQRASDAIRPFSGLCFEECGWNDENTTFTEIPELFEVLTYVLQPVLVQPYIYCFVF